MKSESGKAQPTIDVRQNPQDFDFVQTSGPPITKAKPPAVPPGHGNDGRSGGTGVTLGPAERGSYHRYGRR